MESIMERYKTVKEGHSQLLNPETEAKFWQVEAATLRQNLQSLYESYRHCMGQELSGLSVKELQGLESQLEMGIKNIRTKKDQIIKEKIEELNSKGNLIQQENAELQKKAGIICQENLLLRKKTFQSIFMEYHFLIENRRSKELNFIFFDRWRKEATLMQVSTPLRPSEAGNVPNKLATSTSTRSSQPNSNWSRVSKLKGFIELISAFTYPLRLSFLWVAHYPTLSHENDIDDDKWEASRMNFMAHVVSSTPCRHRLMMATNSEDLRRDTDLTVVQLIMKSILERYSILKQEMDNLHCMSALEAQFLRGEAASMKQQISCLQESHRHLMGEGLSSMCLEELNCLETKLTTSLKNIRARKNQIFEEEARGLKEKADQMEQENKDLRRKLSQIIQHDMKPKAEVPMETGTLTLPSTALVSAPKAEEITSNEPILNLNLSLLGT
ncbi:hypothetical protein SAY87_018853 [Trapa incisa]|uniref:K-box domain-containing protein n=1 Tax=Trapa incisa TaxID=236973 RepID=A0AAN7K3L3_9MYRT|nr:hypothetical protein SAY87_018853 [Trapa incisa]